MKKSKLSLLLLTLLTVGVVSGCKGGNKPSASQSSSVSVAKPSTSSPKEPVTSSSSSKTEVNNSTSTPAKPSTSVSSPSQGGGNETPEVLENKVKDKYRISPNQKLTADNQNLYEAAVGDIKDVHKVEAIKFTFSIDFKGADINHQYWGGEIYVDGNTVILKKYEPDCIFCGNAKDITNFKGKNICASCLKDMKKA